MIKNLISLFLLFFAAAVVGGVALYAVNNQVTAQTGEDESFECACAPANPCPQPNTTNIYEFDLVPNQTVGTLREGALCANGIDEAFTLSSYNDCRDIVVSAEGDTMEICGPKRYVICRPSDLCVDVPISETMIRTTGQTREQAALACINQVAPASPTSGDRHTHILACARRVGGPYGVLEPPMTSCWREDY